MSDSHSQQRQGYLITCTSPDGTTWDSPESLGDAYDAIYLDPAAAGEMMHQLATDLPDDPRFEGCSYSLVPILVAVP